MHFLITILFAAAALPAAVLAIPTTPFTPVAYSMSHPISRRCTPDADEYLSTDGQCVENFQNNPGAYWLLSADDADCSKWFPDANGLWWYNTIVKGGEHKGDYHFSRAQLREQLHEGDQLQFFSSVPGDGAAEEHGAYGKDPKCQHFITAFDPSTPVNSCLVFDRPVECVVLARQEADGYLGKPY